MVGWNHSLHPRGNRTQGNTGQFSQKQQTSSETTLGGLSVGARSVARMIVEDQMQISSTKYDIEKLVDECFEERGGRVILRSEYERPGAVRTAADRFLLDANES